jgi:Methyltransferase domain
MASKKPRKRLAKPTQQVRLAEPLELLPEPAPAIEIVVKSRLVTQKECESEEYKDFCAEIKETPILHRKQWEFYFISKTLNDLGYLKPDMKGLAFGVGKEPLPAYFASKGCEIVATDQPERDAAQQGWAYVYASTLESFNDKGICDQEQFKELVTYRQDVDMNNIPNSLKDFDFVWSSCSFEHLGSIQHGLDFVVNAMKCLRPGGLAVHTTEYKCFTYPPRTTPMSAAALKRREALGIDPSDETITNGGLVLFRGSDFDKLKVRLAEQGHKMFDLDLDLGDGPADKDIRLPPYEYEPPFNNLPHLKLAIGPYASTSVGIAIKAHEI